MPDANRAIPSPDHRGKLVLPRFVYDLKGWMFERITDNWMPGLDSLFKVP
jgi:hypothetical protein